MLRVAIVSFCLAVLPLFEVSTRGEGPLPEFTFQGVSLHPDDLTWIPTGELEHPSVIQVEGRVENPLGGGSERFVLIDPPNSLDDRYRSADFYREGDTIYIFSGADSKPRIYTFATANVNPLTNDNLEKP